MCPGSVPSVAVFMLALSIAGSHAAGGHKEAIQFVDWLQSRETQIIIRDFGKDKYGEPLFFPNSPEGKKL